MEKVLLFSRCDLVHLYGRLSSQLSGSCEITHVAYSDVEERILREKYNIVDIINFKKETGRIHENENFDEELCQHIDEFIIQFSGERFCLNSAIQSDRTFSNQTYEESLVFAQVYYKFWDNLISSGKIKYFLHEPTALYFTHIASILCKKYNAQYLSQIQVYGNSKYNWILVEGDNGFPVEIDYYYNKNKDLTNDEVVKTKAFLEKYRTEKEMLIPELSKIKDSFGKKSLAKYWAQIIRLIIRYIVNSLRPPGRNSLQSTDHVELYLAQTKLSLAESLRKKRNEFFNLTFDSYDASRTFYYYPMHLEPEAVVLYWGDGIYKNQVKLIENIAGQLPSNCYLYVKDHPHGGAYREFIDYKRIKAIPNVKLLHPGVPGRELIEKSRGVLTINGTSGFEAILLNKQVYAFGNSFYDMSDRVQRILNIRDLRKILYENYNIVYKDDIALYKFVNAYLKSVHNGFVSYYANRSNTLNINNESNVEIVALELLKYFQLP